MHVFAQLVPGFETIFTRDYGLGIVQGKTGCAEVGDREPPQRGQHLKAAECVLFFGLRGVKQRFSLFFELLKIGTLR